MFSKPAKPEGGETVPATPRKAIAASLIAENVTKGFLLWNPNAPAAAPVTPSSPEAGADPSAEPSKPKKPRAKKAT